jgi:hypothetical protein
MFRTVPLSIIRRFSLYTQQWHMSYRFADSLLASQKNCMTYTIAVCTVKNSWWCIEELSETCRVVFQNKFEKLVPLVGFIIRIYHDALSSEREIDYFFLVSIPCGNKHTYIQRSLFAKWIILQHFKKLFSSAQTWTNISQQILQNMQHRQTYHLFDEVFKSYSQEKYSTSVHEQRLNRVILYWIMSIYTN